MDSLYRDNILDHYHNPRNFGRLDKPDVSNVADNPFCGDRIGMDVKIKSQKLKVKIIEDVKFHGEGCAISIASASMLTERIIGKPVSEVMKLKAGDIQAMLGIELSPSRLKCALLSLETVHLTLNLAKNARSRV